MKKRILSILLWMGVVSFLIASAPSSTAATLAPELANNEAAEMKLDVIYEGAVVLEEDNFTWTDKNGAPHPIWNFTPHGALEAAPVEGTFDYGGGWKGSKNTTLIDWIEGYEYDNSVEPNMTWNYNLNGVYQDYFSDKTSASNNLISDGDRLEFYYGPDQDNCKKAIAAFRITVTTPPTKVGGI